jgi:hypothetical protein
LALLVLGSGRAAATAPEILAAAQRLPPSGALEAIDAAAECAFAPNARHLGPLPARLVWSRPAAVLIFSGLEGVPEGERAVLLRPTRELLARHAVRERIQAGRVSLHDHDLNTLPETAQEIAFMALHIAQPETPPEGCVTPLSN